MHIDCSFASESALSCCFHVISFLSASEALRVFSLDSQVVSVFELSKSEASGESNAVVQISTKPDGLMQPFMHVSVSSLVVPVSLMFCASDQCCYETLMEPSGKIVLSLNQPQ